MSLYIEKLILKELDEIESNLIRHVIEKDDKLFNKSLKQLQTALVNSYDKQRDKVLNKAIEYLVSVDRDSFSKSDISKINKILQQGLGSDLSEIVTETVNESSKKIFKLGINEIAKSTKLKLSFDVKDKEAAAILGNHSLFWIGNYYDDKLQSNIDEILNTYFTDGKTIKEVAEDFEKRFSDETEKGITYFEQLADFTTSRIRELGKVTGFEKAGVELYQLVAVLDGHTSQICEDLNGTIIPVQKAIDFRDSLLSLESPEDIKSFASWVKPEEVQGLKPEDIPSGATLPPFHFGGCRTQAVAFFK